MSLQIHPLSYALGAELSGIDISKTLNDRTVSQIRSAFLEHSVLLFRDQPLTREQHVMFTRSLGEVDDNKSKVDDIAPDYREIMVVTNKPAPGAKQAARMNKAVGEDWHTDVIHSPVPPMASLLRSVELPEVGGDTMFSNQYRAFDTLSDGMKKLIEGLHGVHIGSGSRIDTSSAEREAETKRRNPPIAQPLVRVHPETGRKALYLTQRLKYLVGMTAEESKPLIEYLCRHSTRPQFVYRHTWRKNDLIMWDNRCTMHIALGDYDKTQTRHLEKTTLIGTPSGYVYDGPLQ